MMARRLVCSTSGHEYYAATWRENVLDNAVVAEIANLPLKPGSHTLEVYTLDPAVTLDRFEIRFVGASKGYGPCLRRGSFDRGALKRGGA